MSEEELKEGFNESAQGLKIMKVVHENESGCRHIVKFRGSVTEMDVVRESLFKGATGEDFIQALIQAKIPRLSDTHLDENDEFHGEYKKWHKNGVLGEVSNYKHGELHGMGKRWYGNGQQSSLAYFGMGWLRGLFWYGIRTAS